MVANSILHIKRFDRLILLGNDAIHYAGVVFCNCLLCDLMHKYLYRINSI